MYASGWCAVLFGIHEVHLRLAIRQRSLVRLPWRRWFAWLRGSGGRHRLRLRDEPDGDDIDRRPAGCGAPSGTLLRSPDFMSGVMCRLWDLRTVLVQMYKRRVLHRTTAG